MDYQPPKSIKDAQSKMNNIRGILDSGKVPAWRRKELEKKLYYLRGWLHGKSAFIDNIVE